MDAKLDVSVGGVGVGAGKMVIKPSQLVNSPYKTEASIFKTKRFFANLASITSFYSPYN